MTPDTPADGEALDPAMRTGWMIHKAGRGWYRPNAQGYTNNPAEAGRYFHEEARSYSHPNGWNGPRDGMTIKHETEVDGAIPRPAEPAQAAQVDALGQLVAIRELLLAGQGDDDGPQILPDFGPDDSVEAMVEACLHLLERRRDVIATRGATDDATAFERADWFWRAMDPDDCGDSPEEAINRAMVGRFCVCEIASSYKGPTRYGFIAPVTDPESDDEEFVHFATQPEAIDEARSRALIAAAQEGRE